MLFAVTVLAFTARAEPRPEAILTDPVSRPSLDGLIRQGLEFSAHGDLDGAQRMWAQIRQEYPEHPAGPIFEIHTLETMKSLDFQDAQYDEQLGTRVKEALAMCEAWLKRAPNDPQAHFYAGQARYEQMLLAGMAGSYYKAGKSGEEGREHLERALALDPSLIDAKMPLGSYYYWASMATRFIRWLTWLWFVPTGEHDLAIEYVTEVSEKGDFFRFDAAVQLAQFQLYFEEQPDLADPILTRLHAEYPENSYVAFEIVELRMMQEDYDGTVAAALALEQAQGEQFGDTTRRTMAKIWRARAELLRGNPEPVGPILDSLAGNWEGLSPWGRRWVLLTRANLQDLEGQREEAIANYERVIELRARWASSRSVKLAQEGLETPFRPVVATITARSTTERSD